jgi:hypothetical protein
MMTENAKETFRLGFLTAIEVADRGFVGGLLVTNHFGRPLEFQCTAPIKPNRTQEILYGPTLVPYVLGELIGKTLVDKVGIKPHLLLTERDDLLPLRNSVAIPVACVHDSEETAEPMRLGRQMLRFHGDHSDDTCIAKQGATVVPNDADLREPFERVREALAEASRTGGMR